jgi:hypothetical protein
MFVVRVLCRRGNRAAHSTLRIAMLEALSSIAGAPAILVSSATSAETGLVWSG